MTKLVVVASVSLIVAYCSIIYELLLAQSLAIVLGQSFLRYTLTIGFYLFSLGMGALAVEWLPKSGRVRILIAVELVLCVLGALAPWLIFAGEAALSPVLSYVGLQATGGVGALLVVAYMHSWIFVIGILSGCEIPLLMELAEDLGGEKAATYVLGIDYIGTFIGAVSFPFVTYHYLGIVAGAACSALLNAVAALLVILTYRSPGDGRRVMRQAFVGLALLVGTCLILRHESALRKIMVDLFMSQSVAIGS